MSIGTSFMSSSPLETRLGKLIGTRIAGASKEVIAYKGIPYALPPVGNNRWRPAQPAEPWNCTRDASAFGPQAIQPTEPESAFFSLPQSVQSEDCLYLNVWTPVEPGEKTRLPVMVWVHGGAFIGGAGSIPVYDGAALARKGVVLVTINYRVGIFGYFAHPELIAEANGGICANFGTSDQIEALRWIKNNIADFGGDPDNVTVFGESAGAMSVCQLMASPLARGLFDKAVGQSGGFFFPMRELGRSSWGGPPAEEFGRLFGKRIGAHTLAELRQMPARELVAAAQTHGDLLNQLGALMVVDGIVFERSVHDTFRQGKQHAVPILLGFNADEGSGIADYGSVPGISDPGLYENMVRASYGEFADEYLTLYPANDPQGAAFDAFRDQAFGWHMMEWAHLTEKISRPAYLYYFNHVPPGAEIKRAVAGGKTTHRIGAHHASEIAYVFNNIDRKLASVWGDGLPHVNRPAAPPSPVDIHLADLMSDFWVAFARTGIPQLRGQPEWHPYNSQKGNFMKFGSNAETSANLLPGMWSLHSRINAAREAKDLYWYMGNLGLYGPILND